MASKDRPYWVIPAALALLIPIIAVLSEAPTVLSVLFGIAVITAVPAGGGWFLMQERHKLRMKEIEAEASLKSAEREHMQTVERILDKDDRVSELRRELES
jgi:hypothetical protein